MTLVRFFLAAALSGFSFVVVAASAEPRCADVVGTVVSAQGDVGVGGTGTAEVTRAAADFALCAGDTLAVRRFARALFRLDRDQTNVQLGDNTTMAITGSGDRESTVLDMKSGVAHVISRVPLALNVKTPFADIVVRDAEFVVKIDEQQAVVSVLDGRLEVSNETGRTIIKSGKTVFAKAHATLTDVKIENPMEAVQWALYYPPVFEFVPSDFTNYGLESWRGFLADSVRALQKNDVTSALSLIDQAGDGIKSGIYRLYRANLLLMVGRVDETQADLDRADAAGGNVSDAWALRAVIAVTQGRHGEALDAAKKAIAADPKSAAARIAMSLVYQAHFDLDAALGQALIAVDKERDNALAWARVAEAQLMRGEVEEAFRAAERAEKLNPHSAQAKTVLGYVHLIRSRVGEAAESFSQAIQIDPAAPMQRLGLGIVRIRQGDLTAGRADIEIATSLNSRNSLLRSYVGKAYYDERRTALASRQLELAKDLDTSDPTPWFYDAIATYGVNRPLDALFDAQRSIELNDRRAVYRSRLQIDEDMAARELNPARVYHELGFGQAGLAEAFRSLNDDPANYSAHRFLAESYAVLPRHEIARVSEALQAQLMQPISAHAIAPQMLENPLASIENVNAPSVGYGEYGALFIRNGITAHIAAAGGGDHSNGDELLVSGIANRFSLAVSRSRFETDGFRDNSEFNRTLVSALAQYAMTANTNVQVEYRKSDTENGDTALRFDPANYSTSLNQHREFDVYRVGWHQQFSSHAYWLGSLLKRVDDLHETQDVSGAAYDTGSEDTAYQYEFLFAWGSETSDHRFGIVRYVGSDVRTIHVNDPILGISDTPANQDLYHNAFYYYWQWNCCANLQFTTGVTWENVERRQPVTLTRYKLDPKLGVTLELSSDTVLRFAAFRTFNHELISNQTIEPTQVAGFNQFYQDEMATDARVAGIGLDRRFSGGASAGVEWFGRNMVVPYVDATTSKWRDSEWVERGARSYLYIPIGRRVALSLEYFMELYRRAVENTGDDQLTHLTTWRVPIGLSWFTPVGFSATIKATSYQQDILWLDPATLAEISGRDEFWYFDLQLGYRFPYRWGQIQLGVRNLTDQKFHYQDMDPTRLSVYPHRVAYARVTANF